MKYTKGTIIRRSRPGNTLIELITALSIISILTTAVLSAFIFFSRDFNRSVIESREEFYIGEAFRYIESEVCSGNSQVDFYPSYIRLKRYLEVPTYEEIDYIKREGENLVIEHTKRGYGEATNVFLRKVSNFAVKVDEEVVIIEITTDKGGKYSKCINTQYIR
ncbi:type II secretion system protein [Clostridium thermarum]|uniref:type II secretion system protein n=1 Tax=Clostridium thermarum TaxID=1716543 RepID=UPI0013D5449E|nr:type II secretion system protein [Clostridium thermarum]